MLGRAEAGDTLVEVLVSIAVMTSITVGVLAVLNKGIAEAQNAGERVSVRGMVSEQVELLNYFRDSYMEARSSGAPTTTYPFNVWPNISTYADDGTSLGDADSCTPANRPFYFEYNGSQYELKPFDRSAAIAPGMPSPNNGIWIEAEKYDASAMTNGVSYTDAVVKSCWQSITGIGEQKLSSAVRLYDSL